MIRWQVETNATDGIASDGGRVFVLGGELVTCIALESGTVLWSAPAPGSAGPIPTAVDDGALLAEFPGRRVAFAVDTGRVVDWPSSHPSLMTPVDVQGSSLVAQDGALVLRRGKSERWRRPLEVGAKVLQVGTVVVIVGSDGTCVLDGSGAVVAELTPESSSFDPSPAIQAGESCAVFTDAGGMTWCIDTSKVTADADGGARPRKGTGHVFFRHVAAAIGVRPSDPLGRQVFALPEEKDGWDRSRYAEWFGRAAVLSMLEWVGWFEPADFAHDESAPLSLATLVFVETAVLARAVSQPTGPEPLVAALLVSIEAPQPYHLDEATYAIARTPTQARVAAIRDEIVASRATTFDRGVRDVVLGPTADWDPNDQRFAAFPTGLNLGWEVLAAAENGTPLTDTPSMQRVRQFVDDHVDSGRLDEAMHTAGYTGERVAKFAQQASALGRLGGAAALLANVIARSPNPDQTRAAFRDETAAYLSRQIVAR